MQKENETIISSERFQKIADTEMCRICHETKEENPKAELISPCVCGGSIKLVHRECLMGWLKSRGKYTNCDICGTKFQWTRPNSTFLRYILDRIRTPRDTFRRLLRAIIIGIRHLSNGPKCNHPHCIAMLVILFYMALLPVVYVGKLALWLISWTSYDQFSSMDTLNSASFCFWLAVLHIQFSVLIDNIHLSNRLLRIVVIYPIYVALFFFMFFILKKQLQLFAYLFKVLQHATPFMEFNFNTLNNFAIGTLILLALFIVDCIFIEGFTATWRDFIRWRDAKSAILANHSKYHFFNLLQSPLLKDISRIISF